MSDPTEGVVLDLFDRTPSEPLTAADVASETGWSRRATRDRLNALVDRGCLQTKEVVDGTRVWWRIPRERDSREESGPGETIDGNEGELESELAATRELQEISTRLIQEGDIDELYDQVVDAAIAIVDADFGSLQLFDADRENLQLLSHREFDSAAVEFWDGVDPESRSIYSEALERGTRIVVSDIEADESVIDPTVRETYQKIGIRAMQSTPLLSRSGDVLGLLSTHWATPHEPSDRYLRLLDVLARQAADLIERRQSEAQLHESEERFRAFVTASSDVVYRMNPDWTEMRYLEGRDFIPDTDEPTSSWVDAYIPPDEQQRVEEAINEAIRTTSVFELEHRVFRVDDTHGWTLSRAVPIMDDGEIVEWLGTARDITERKSRERRLEKLIERLETSNERLEHFAYAASHDLQEPLRMVSSYLRLIESRYGDAFDDDGEEFLEYAIHGADRMRNMIDGLLAYSRVETQGASLEPVDLESVLENARENLRVRIEESDAEVTGGDLPRITGDGGQLRQVFQNLLHNAIEYSGDDSPRIHVSAERGESEWIIAVRDKGIGIDPNQQSRIFDVFERLHSRQEHSGTGIGLALCERIVERHGGRIWVDSDPGNGSTFFFTVPPV